MALDDAGVVHTGVIEDRPTAAAEELGQLRVEAVGVESETAARRGDADDASPPVATEAAPEAPSKRTMPTGKATRQRADEFGRIAIKAGAVVATFGRNVAHVCRTIASFGWHVISEVPPALRLLGALALSVAVSAAGSLTLDSALGVTCAVVFVPGFSLAFGVVAHRWYISLGEGRAPSTDVKDETPSTPDLHRSVEYVDGKLAFALSAFGTERHQEAVVALIQAKTATELSFGTPASVQHGLRPRIRDGGGFQTPRQDAVSGA
ncbi:hypothetical protein [Mycolicibacterium hodleri]|nr:hypothetical protein [Mycolicibacterium hodleri]